MTMIGRLGRAVCLLSVLIGLATIQLMEPIGASSDPAPRREDRAPSPASPLPPDGGFDMFAAGSAALHPTAWGTMGGEDGGPRFGPSLAPLAPQSAAETWNPLGLGLWDYVRAVAVAGTDVYAGGDFTNAGGNSDADYVARWDGASWQAVGSGLNDVVYAMAVTGSDVYVGGPFTGAGGNPDADHIARWDGQAWQPLGPGLSHFVATIAVVGPDVYAGGGFFSAGGIEAASHLARWGGCPRVYLPLVVR